MVIVFEQKNADLNQTFLLRWIFNLERSRLDFESPDIFYVLACLHIFYKPVSLDDSYNITLICISNFDNNIQILNYLDTIYLDTWIFNVAFMPSCIKYKF